MRKDHARPYAPPAARTYATLRAYFSKASDINSQSLTPTDDVR